MNRRLIGAVGALAASTLVLAACGSSSSSSPTTSSASAAAASAGATAGSGGASSASGGASSASGGASSAAGGGTTGPIVVGSANFDESVILMYIYADALKAKGVDATVKPKIGSREVYIPALKDGSIDLIPEYSGTLLAYFDKTSTAASSADIYKALPAVVGPAGMTVLEQSEAQDKDSIAVTADTAKKYNLKTIGDLASHASSMVLGAAPEFKTRADGVPGLDKTYGVKFGTFKTLDAGGKLSVTALKNGQVDAADLFTTDPSIPENGFVVLQDPKNLYTAQNVLPLIATKKVTPLITKTLNAVSAKLDTATLTALDKQEYGGTDAEKVAQDWLKAQGLS
ncbi:osmoprotectant transport system substrate-binding protein [Nakamurella panacisegetis]|uniref:Osmoprotectant transport system substrate-binding protein n=1 Tax=Nakamurella panacisegetis TaxID=1090615 RepID=A0A1H0NVK3_9ACTN|nr:ABC transporter substrate-binding protein [Nakamurella panacisegetis]SDO96782.1 osmoprotectant transport system substrate-binding protein [Nakamurella panacisegetis]